VTYSADTPGSAAHPCLHAFKSRPFIYKPPTLQDMQAGMGGAPSDGATLAIHLIATVEDFEILRQDRHRFSQSMAAGAMATGARLF